MIIIEKHLKVSGNIAGMSQNATLADSELFKSNVKIRQKIPNDGNSKNVEIAVPLKYLSNFWRTLEMQLINCKINLDLTWSTTCVITNSTGARTFAILIQNLVFPLQLYQLKIMQKH